GDRSFAARPPPFAGHDERRAPGDDADPLRVDAGKLHDDRQLGWVGPLEAVDLGPVAALRAREAGHLPEIGEELLDLLLQAIDVSPPGHAHNLPGLGSLEWRRATPPPTRRRRSRFAALRVVRRRAQRRARQGAQ